MCWMGIGFGSCQIIMVVSVVAPAPPQSGRSSGSRASPQNKTSRGGLPQWALCRLFEPERFLETCPPHNALICPSGHDPWGGEP